MNHLAKEEHKRRLEKLYNETGKHFIGPGAFMNDKRGIFERGYPYSTNHKNIKKWFRRMANRKFRRGKNENEDILARSEHKKNFDLWWKLY